MTKTTYQHVDVFPDRKMLDIALNAILTCGHPHWFAVKLGDPSLAIETHHSGHECIKSALEDAGVITYDF